ncbi:MAG: UbiA-like polyprenyltransferase [Planctomycetota bacterium]
MNESEDSATSKLRVADWLGLIRFSHTIFALPFAALAWVLALRTPLPASLGSSPGPDSLGSVDAAPLRPDFDVLHVVGVLLCMVFARSAAMAFNRLLDHRFDAANPRTAGRHLPAGILSPRSVRRFTWMCSLGFIASTLCFWPNPLPLFLSVPVLAFLCGYTLAKRFTSMAHLWLGVALALSPICVWVAIRGVPAATTPSDFAIPLMIAGVVTTWVTGFDIIYACQDADFDAQEGLFSIPAKLGVAGALRFSAMCHLLMIPMLMGLNWFGQAAGLGWIFSASLLVIAGLVIYQHRLVRPDDLSRVGQAFFHTNATISCLLLVAGSIDAYW